jgi:hypothetical protein
LVAEKGALGILALEGALHALDPYGMMNPGKLIPTGDFLLPSK